MCVCVTGYEKGWRWGEDIRFSGLVLCIQQHIIRMAKRTANKINKLLQAAVRLICSNTMRKLLPQMGRSTVLISVARVSNFYLHKFWVLLPGFLCSSRSMDSHPWPVAQINKLLQNFEDAKLFFPTAIRTGNDKLLTKSSGLQCIL